MTKLSSHFFRAASLALALPILGMCAAVQINTACYGPGSCTTPANTTDAVTNGNPVIGSASHNITVGTDTYTVSYSYNSSYNGSGESIVFNPAVTYTGSAASTSNDTVTVNFFQDIYDPTPGPFSASTQTEYAPITIGAGNESATAQLFFNGSALPLLGPVTTIGTSYLSNSESFGPVNSSYLGYEYQFVFSFTAGLAPGSGVSSNGTTPEPAQAIPAGLALVGFALAAYRRRK